jgi:excinuclease ABC subunit B
VPGSRSKKRKGMAKAAEESARYENELRSPSEISKRIRQLEEKMYQLARDLEFEAAAQLRDDIHKLRERLLQV